MTNLTSKEKSKDDKIIPSSPKDSNHLAHEITPLEKALPEEVKASHKIDKENYLKEQKPLVVDLPTTPTQPKSNKKNKDLLKLFLKSVLIIGGTLGIIILILIFFYLTNLDTKFIKITLTGKVTDSVLNSPISNATITVEGLQTKTNSQGNYSLSGLDPGNTSVKVQAEGYDDLTQVVPISRLLLDYTSKANFQLNPSSFSDLSGKLIPNSSSYSFSSDTLTLNGNSLNINKDGTFSATHVKTGSAVLEFDSINFKTIKQTINLTPGNNQIAPITLIPAGVITGILKSYVREDIILNAKFYVEDVLQTQVTIGSDGSFMIKDLDVGKSYKIRVESTGYKTREYSITISQGDNQLPNFRMVEDASAVYLFTVNNLNSLQFFSSDLDGANSTQLTSDSNLNPSLENYLKSTNTLYFLSTRDNINNGTNGTIAVPYSFTLGSSTFKLILNSTTSIGKLYPNFIAQKMVNVFQYSDSGTNTNAELLQLMNLDGTNSSTILNNDNLDISTARISDNGNVVVYYENAPNKGLYRYDTSTKSSSLISPDNGIKIFDISSDGSKVVFQRTNSSTNLNDLVLSDSTASSITTIKQNLDGSDYQFNKLDNNQILYFANRAGGYNIYRFTIDQNKDEQITNLTSDYQINYLYQEAGFLFYLTNKGLYVLDPSKPVSLKVVTQNDSTFTGYNYP